MGGLLVLIRSTADSSDPASSISNLHWRTPYPVSFRSAITSCALVMESRVASAAFQSGNDPHHRVAGENIDFKTRWPPQLRCMRWFCRVFTPDIVRHCQQRIELMPIMPTPQALPRFGSCDQPRTLWTTIDDNAFGTFFYNSCANAVSERIRSIGKRSNHIWVVHCDPSLSKQCRHLVACVFCLRLREQRLIGQGFQRRQQVTVVVPDICRELLFIIVGSGIVWHGNVWCVSATERPRSPSRGS